MGMLSILYVSTTYILTTNLKMTQKRQRLLESVHFFFFAKNCSVLSLTLPAFDPGGIVHVHQDWTYFLKPYTLQFVISNSRMY